MTDKELELVSIRAIIEGRVQGVGFRHFVWQHASRLGLKGWVRNRWEGTVELVAEGEKDQISQLVSVLWKGPRMAFVTQVKVDPQDVTGEFQNFDIRSSV